MNWDTNPFAIRWKAKNNSDVYRFDGYWWNKLSGKTGEMEHNEENKDCLRNRCGEWAECNNHECEGEHLCTCV